jgi:hypothetical protein
VPNSSTKRELQRHLLAQGLRRCHICRIVKQLEEFNKSKNRLAGRRYACRGCTTAEYKRRKHNPEFLATRNAKTKTIRARAKSEVIAHYSKESNKCACCGEANVKFLTVDHINDDGYLKRQSGEHPAGGAMYVWLRAHNYPEGFQILCMNCNAAKGWYGTCPHKECA